MNWKTFSYDAWIAEQATVIETEMRKLGRSGRSDLAIYVTRSNGAVPGKLVPRTSTEPPVEGACNVCVSPVLATA